MLQPCINYSRNDLKENENRFTAKIMRRRGDRECRIHVGEATYTARNDVETCKIEQKVAKKILLHIFGTNTSVRMYGKALGKRKKKLKFYVFPW